MEDLDFENLINIKSQLLSYPDDVLLDVYKDENLYRIFLYIVHEYLLNYTDDTLYVDAFIYLDEEISDKIYRIINIHRFDLDDVVFNVVNDLIIFLNSALSANNEAKNELLNEYVNYNSYIRRIKINDLDMLKEMIVFDSLFLDRMKNNDLEYLEEHDMSILSINYFMVERPELFDDPEFLLKTYYLLGSFLNQGPLLKHYSKKSIKQLKKVNNKGE